MENSNFIGVGKNPDGPDLPLGFGMQLAQSPKAMEAFGKMSKTQKAALIDHIQGAATGEDAKARIAGAVDRLSKSHTMF